MHALYRGLFFHIEFSPALGLSRAKSPSLVYSILFQLRTAAVAMRSLCGNVRVDSVLQQVCAASALINASKTRPVLRSRNGASISIDHPGPGGRSAVAAAAPPPAAAATARQPFIGHCSVNSSGSSRQPQRLLSTSAGRHDELLRGIDSEDRETVARIVEQAERAVDNWTVLFSDFVRPPVAAATLSVLSRMADTAAVAWGGYQQAERVRDAQLGLGVGVGGLPEAAHVHNQPPHPKNACTAFPPSSKVRIAVGREEELETAATDPATTLESGVAALSIKGNFLFDPAR